jgi:hypothetical protein
VNGKFKDIPDLLSESKVTSRSTWSRTSAISQYSGLKEILSRKSEPPLSQRELLTRGETGEVKMKLQRLLLHGCSGQLPVKR